MGVLDDALDKVKTVFRGNDNPVSYDNTYSHRKLQDDGLTVEEQKMPLVDLRVLFVKEGCHICPKWEKAVREFNTRARIGGRIRIIEINSYHPLINKVDLKGTPELWIDGVVVRGATSAEGQYGFLKGFLQDEFEVRLEP